MSSHKAKIVMITNIIQHPNADNLSIIMIDDFQVIVRTDDWKLGDLALYVEPDSIVPDIPEFAFLNGNRRIKARKLCGEWSIGLLVPAPPEAKLGDDYMDQLGITHYEPEIRGHFSTGGDNIEAPPGFYPIYDIENFRKYPDIFQDGEEVIVTEKTHGASSKFVCVGDQIYCGSRKHWKKEDPNNLWWKALNQCEVLEAWLRHHQNLAVYGEVFGAVQNLKYGARSGEIKFAAFDILQGNQWLDFDAAHVLGAPLPWVPLIYRGPFNKDKILAFAEGDSIYPGAQHHREGVVIKPVYERTNCEIGRVQLKVVGNRYLSKS